MRPVTPWLSARCLALPSSSALGPENTLAEDRLFRYRTCAMIIVLAGLPRNNFTAPDWATFANKCVAYSLQHADRKLKAFAQANELLTGEGANIEDSEPKEGEGSGRPLPRRTEDPTAQKRVEFIATSVLEIAHRNPEGEVEKPSLAAVLGNSAPRLSAIPTPSSAGAGPGRGSASDIRTAGLTPMKILSFEDKGLPLRADFIL